MTDNIANIQQNIDLKETTALLGTSVPEIETNDLAPLNGLKGVLVLFIVVGHYFNYFTYNLFFGLDYLQAVTLFFLVSAIALKRLYGDGKVDSCDQRWYFLRKRFARLAPTYYLSLAISFPVWLLNIGFDIGTFISCLFFVQSFYVGFNYWNGPLWQVSVFLMGYACFPWIEKWFRKMSKSKLWMAGFAIYTISSGVLPLFIYLMNAPVEWHVSVARILHFILGIIIAEFIERSIKQGNDTARWKKMADILSVFFLLIFIAEMFEGYLYPMLPNYSYWTEFMLAPVHCMWLFSLVRGQNSLTGWLLSIEVFKRLGNLSYALYCIHFPMFYLYSWAVTGRVLPVYFGIGTFALPFWHIFIILFVDVCLAQLVTVFFERPLRKWWCQKKWW